MGFQRRTGGSHPVLSFTISGPGRRGCALAGLTLVAFTGVFVSIVRLLTPEPSAADAERMIRVGISTVVTTQLTASLGNRSVPSREESLVWKARLDSLNAIRMEGVHVRRPLPDWFNVRASWVVRMRQTDPGAPPRVRYYWLPRYGLARETSRWIWWFSL